MWVSLRGGRRSATARSYASTQRPSMPTGNVALRAPQAPPYRTKLIAMAGVIERVVVGFDGMMRVPSSTPMFEVQLYSMAGAKANEWRDPVLKRMLGGSGVLEGSVLSKPLTRVFQARLNCTSSCLLYTSPSPRDRQKSRMPSSA